MLKSFGVCSTIFELILFAETFIQNLGVLAYPDHIGYKINQKFNTKILVGQSRDLKPLKIH